MTTTVGVYIHDAGIWKRAMPRVNVSGIWKNCQKVHVKVAGTWQVAWADAERSLGLAAKSLADLDFSSPFFVSAGWRMQSGGGVQTFMGSNTYAADGSWLLYDAGHAFQVKFVDTGNNNLDLVPTLDTFLETTGTLTLESTRVTQGIESGAFDVTFIDKAAPGPAPIIRTVSISVLVDALGV